MATFDLIIIGGGPTGINCAIAARKAGLNYLVLEKGVLVNSIYHFPTNMTFFSTSKLLEIGEVPFISHLDKPTRMEALEYYRRLVEQYELKINPFEEVLDMKPLAGQAYRITTSRDNYTTRSVIIATGFYDLPRMLNVPGEELDKVRHYYNDPHPYVGQRVLVVGAANSACDVALETWSKGAEVSMVIRAGEISKRVKYWIRPNIVNRIKEGSIKAYFHTQVTAIREGEVDLEGPSGALTIPNDFVLAMTGYQPNFKLLEKLGVKLEKEGEDLTPFHRAESLETNLPNVFLAGVVCAGMRTSRLFIENTRDHAGKIMDVLQERLSKRKGSAKPV